MPYSELAVYPINWIKSELLLYQLLDKYQRHGIAIRYPETVQECLSSEICDVKTLKAKHLKEIISTITFQVYNLWMSTQLMLNWKPTTQLGTAYDSEKKYKIYQQSCKIILVLKQVVKLFLVIHLLAQNLKLDKLNMPHQTTMHQSENPAKMA